jgi:mannose-6-phosphate isomerase-like protein (cupin superfamily)
MKSFELTGKHAWKVLGGTARSQAAEMVIPPGKSEGGPDNRHAKSDQWMWIFSGQGEALIEGRRVPLKAGMLLLIEKGERHQILASGRSSLRTLNIYAPPAY